MKDEYCCDVTSDSVIYGPFAMCNDGSNTSLVQVVLLDDSTRPGGLGGAHMEGGGA